MDWTALVNSLPNIVLLILALIVLWLVLRFLLRLALRVFACGCAVIAALAAVLILLHYLSQQP